MPQTHPSREQLAAFDRGLLPGPDQSAIEQHVAGCVTCCQALETLDDDPLITLLRDSPPRAVVETVASGLHDTPASATGSPQVPPELLAHPRYRIISLLGSGGMGAVFQAEHRVMERRVALKVINPALVSKPGAVERFRQEIKAASRLAHPNIVTAYDADQAGDVHFLVMELVEGQSLDELIDPGRPVPIPLACAWIRQAALGLQHAHERGMVHRDIKPGNLLVASGQGLVASENKQSGSSSLATSHSPLATVKILDFGLARFVSEAAAGTLTPSGAVVGTPDYIAPEQARAPGQADIRADIYSLGCTLYHLLAGQVPYPQDTVLQKLIAHQETPARPLGELRPDVPPELVGVIERMMAKDPADRFASPAEVAAALEPFTRDVAAPASPSPRPRRSLAVGAGAAVAVVAVAGVGLASLLSHRGDRPTQSITVTRPGPVAAAPTEPAFRLVTPANAPARDRAVAWVRNHQRTPGNTNFPEAIARNIDDSLSRGSGMVLHIGANLLADNKPMLLAIRTGQLHVFELAPDAGLSPSETIRYHIPRGSPKLQVPEAVKLSELTLETPERLTPGATIRGSVRYAAPTEPRGKYAVQLTVLNGGLRRVHYQHLRGGIAAGKGSWNFTLPTQDEGGKIAGPVLIYVEVCIPDVSGKAADAIIVSNTLATLVHVVKE